MAICLGSVALRSNSLATGGGCLALFRLAVGRSFRCVLRRSGTIWNPPRPSRAGAKARPPTRNKWPFSITSLAAGLFLPGPFSRPCANPGISYSQRKHIAGMEEILQQRARLSLPSRHGPTQPFPHPPLHFPIQLRNDLSQLPFGDDRSAAVGGRQVQKLLLNGNPLGSGVVERSRREKCSLWPFQRHAAIRWIRVRPPLKCPT